MTYTTRNFAFIDSDSLTREERINILHDPTMVLRINEAINLLIKQYKIQHGKTWFHRTSDNIQRHVIYIDMHVQNIITLCLRDDEEFVKLKTDVQLSQYMHLT